MILTARARPLLYWLIGLSMVCSAIVQWLSHGATGLSVTSIVLSLVGACLSVVQAVRVHLHPRPFTLTLGLAKLLIVVLVFIPSSTIIAMAVFLTHFDTPISTVDKICFLLTTLPSLLYLGAGSWLAFRYFCLWRERRRGPDEMGK